MANGTKAVMGLMFGVLLAVVLFQPVISTVNSNTGVQTVTNETVTADVGNYVDLSGYDIERGTVTVYVPNGSSYDVATDGTDYEVAYQNGSLKALSSGSIADGDQLKVTYDYQATDGSTSTVLGLVPLLMAVLVIGIMGKKISSMT